MNKWYAIAIVVALLVSAPAVAQQQEQDPQDPANVNVQVVTVPVQQVYEHSLGYVVVYTRSDLYPATVYLPGRWFQAAGGQGEIILSNHPSVPYMSIYYENGEFSLVRLFAPENRAHRAWGSLRSGMDLEDEFSVDTLEMTY